PRRAEARAGGPLREPRPGRPAGEARRRPRPRRGRPAAELDRRTAEEPRAEPPLRRLPHHQRDLPRPPRRPRGGTATPPGGAEAGPEQRAGPRRAPADRSVESPCRNEVARSWVVPKPHSRNARTGTR